MITQSIRALLLGVAVSFTVIDGNAMERGYVRGPVVHTYEDLEYVMSADQLLQATLAPDASADLRAQFNQMRAIFQESALIEEEKNTGARQIHKAAVRERQIESQSDSDRKTGYRVLDDADVMRLINTGEILKIDETLIGNIELRLYVRDMKQGYGDSLAGIQSPAARRYAEDEARYGMEGRTSVTDLKNRHQALVTSAGAGTGGQSIAAQEYEETVKKSGLSVKERAKQFSGGK
jgi:hypothetical protein